MSRANKYVASDLFNEPTSTGVANTNDWVASMRGMMLMYADGSSVKIEQQSDHDFDSHMAETLDITEANAGSWDEIKTKFGL